MLIAVSLVCAVLAAASNALGNVMQRRAALIVPRSDRFRIGLMWDLLRTPVWVLGIGGVILAALFQGAALATGPLAVVQPVFLLELPFTLLVAGIAFRRPMPRATWLSVGSIVVSLCLGLFAAAPGGGTLQAPASLWTAVMTCCLGAMAVLCTLAVRRRVGPSRAACMALAGAAPESIPVRRSHLRPRENPARAGGTNPARRADRRPVGDRLRPPGRAVPEVRYGALNAVGPTVPDRRPYARAENCC
ncbi:hypothetical protein ACWCQW_00510 [Streptomyces mirabilis]